MKEAKLADDIMAALKKGPAPDEVMSLGSMYVEAMGEARRRLEQCVDLIRKGKESAALQEAQFAPPLMDMHTRIKAGLAHLGVIESARRRFMYVIVCSLPTFHFTNRFSGAYKYGVQFTS